MAKWGEGDPRWIVEDRPDGTNVNNWHWKEKDATAWSKNVLKELLSELKFEDAKGNSLEVEEVNFGDECEAVINNRKQKLIFLYEFHITLKCSGYTWENDKITGKINIPNLEQQEPLNDVIIEYSQETPKSTDLKYYDFVKEHCRPFIREKLGVYIDKLKNEYSKDLVLPSKVTHQNQSALPAKTGDKPAPTTVKVGATKQSTGIKIATFKLQMKETFQATAHDVLEAFLDKPRVEAFTCSAVKLERSRGGAFSLYDGNITGFFDEMVPPVKLVMRWRKRDWPTEHYSKVSIALEEQPDSGETVLTLDHSLIPSATASEQDMTNGWKMMFFQPMKQRLALGYLL